MVPPAHRGLLRQGEVWQPRDEAGAGSAQQKTAT